MHWTEINDRVAGDVIILDVRGHLTLSDEQNLLYKRVSELAESGLKRVVLNLSRVPYVDSVGIGEIVRAYMRLTNAGGLLRVCEAPPRIREVLEATNLNTVLPPFESEDEALRSFGPRR